MQFWYFEFEPIVQDEMMFKDISFLKLCWSYFWVKRNRFCNFGRRNHEEQFCEIILNLDQWFRRRCHLKTIFI